MQTQSRIDVLSVEDMDRIKNFMLRMLDEVGYWVEDPWVRDLFDRHGYRVQGDRVHASPDQTLAFLHAYRDNHPLKPQPPRGEIARQQAAYLGVSDVHILDWDTQKKRPGTLEDNRRAALVVNRLDWVKSLGVAVLPHEAHPQLRGIAGWLECAKNSPKAYSGPPGDQMTPVNFRYFQEIRRIVQGLGPDEPCPVGGGADVVSPLRLPKFSSDKLRLVVDSGATASVASCALQGMTAMVTVASVVAQLFAEVLFGGLFVTLLETEKYGAPRYNLRMGGASFVPTDLRHMREACAAMDGVLAHIAISQMEEHLGLPISRSNYSRIKTEAKLPDIQAGYEKMGTCLLSMLGGLHWFTAPGELCTNAYFSLEQALIDHEVAAMVSRAARGVAVGEHCFDMDAFKAGVARGQFTDLDHTLEHYREEMFLPEFASKEFYDTWDKHRMQIGDKAHARIEEILETAQPQPKFDADILREIDKALGRFAQELGS